MRVTDDSANPSWGQVFGDHYRQDNISVEIVFDQSSNPTQDDADVDRANHGLSRDRKLAPGKAIEINYTKQNEHSYFSDEEVKRLLKENDGPGPLPSNGVVWKKGRVKKKHGDFLRYDGGAIARVYWEGYGIPNTGRRIRVKAGHDLPVE